jgi:hypothetical protein
MWWVRSHPYNRTRAYVRQSQFMIVRARTYVRTLFIRMTRGMWGVVGPRDPRSNYALAACSAGQKLEFPCDTIQT